MRPKALILLVPRKGARQKLVAQRLRIVPEALLHAQVGTDLLLGLERSSRPQQEIHGHKHTHADTHTPRKTTKTTQHNNTTKPKQQPERTEQTICKTPARRGAFHRPAPIFKTMMCKHMQVCMTITFSLQKRMSYMYTYG